MKKLLTVMVVALLLFTLVGCGEQADSPPTPEETPSVADITPEPTEPVSPTSADEEVGIIIGDVFYKDIPISRLFLEPFIDVLGEPIDTRSAFFFYEGLEIMGLLSSAADEEEWADYDNVAIQLDAFDPHLGLFTLNGVPLVMTRAELIATFGAPYYDIVDHDHSLTYRISSPAIEYRVTFRFESPDDDAPVSSISMSHTAE